MASFTVTHEKAACFYDCYERKAELQHSTHYCPGCGHGVSTASFRLGSTAVCPACTEMFVVGGPSRLGSVRRTPEESPDDEGPEAA